MICACTAGEILSVGSEVFALNASYDASLLPACCRLCVFRCAEEWLVMRAKKGLEGFGLALSRNLAGKARKTPG